MNNHTKTLADTINADMIGHSIRKRKDKLTISSGELAEQVKRYLANGGEITKMKDSLSPPESRKYESGGDLDLILNGEE